MAGPIGTPLGNQAHFRHGKFVGGVAQGVVKVAALAMRALPNNRHDYTVDPGCMLPAESRRHEYLISGVNMRVILLRMIIEILNTDGNRVGSVHHIDPIVYNIAGMGDPLPAGAENPAE